jgi:hypothetical protein
MLNFVKGFFPLKNSEKIVWFLSLTLFMCYITFINLYILNHHCIPGMKLTWLWYMIFCIVLLNFVCRYSENFWTYVHQKDCSIILFVLCPCLFFQYWLYRMGLVAFLHFLIYGKVWGCWYYFFKGLVEFSHESITSWTFLCWETLTASITLLI